MGNWYRKRYAQAITGIYVDRCDPNAIVWAQLANAEFLQAIFSYGSPGWKDVIDMGTGRSWLKHGRAKMNEGHHPRPKWLNDTGQFLGDLAEGLDRVAWLLMVIETFGGAALKWASAAYQVSPCEAHPDYGFWSSNEPLGFYDGQDSWQDGPIWVVNKGNQGAFASSRLLLPAGYQGYIYVAANFDKFVGFGGLDGWDTRIIEGSGKTVSHHSYTIPDGGASHGPIDFHWMPAVPNDRLLRWQWRPHIIGGFTETWVTSGAASAVWHKPGVSRKSQVISYAPRAYNFSSVLDDLPE